MKTNQLFVSRIRGILSAAMTTACLLICPASIQAQGGVPLWTNRYDGPANGDDRAKKIATDNSGNVFVAGESWNGSNNDILTIKYSSAGAALWTNRYNGSSNGDDYAGAIAVDTNGSVFVTGASEASPFVADYVTIKYSNSGVPLWTNRYDGPGNDDDRAAAVAVDNNGNIIVAGTSRSASSADFATIQYSGTGAALWTNRYNGAANSADIVTGIAVDAAGNVFVTGVSGVSSLPNDTDYATVAYTSTGSLLWTKVYDGPNDVIGNSEDQPHAIAVGNSGNVFVTGHSFNGLNIDYATIAYSPSGIPVWTNRYNGPANGYDSPSVIAVDRSGNVFVTGNSVAANGVSDFATIAYSGTGQTLWTRRYNGPANSEDIAYALALDKGGNVLVTGRTFNGSNYDYATAAYSSSGEPLWATLYNGTSNRDDQPSAIAVDRDGNVFVTGNSTASTTSDYVTIKYSSSIPPARLAFQKLNNQLVLSWTNAGFSLQSSLVVTGAYSTIPGATSPYTNPFSAPQQFFRLISN